jgi:hypothetical protein
LNLFLDIFYCRQLWTSFGECLYQTLPKPRSFVSNTLKTLG